MPRRPDFERAGGRDVPRRQPASAGVKSRRPKFWLVIACMLLANATSARAASPNQATSSRVARDEAIRSVPYEKIAPEMSEKVRSAVTHASIYRRLPIQVTDCDPDLYLFLVRHPEVVVNIWEVMKISNVALSRTGADTFRASDGAGTLCEVKFCYGDHDTHVIYAEGSYDGPLFNRPVQAKCVLVLKSGYMRETDGRYHVTSRMDTFIQIDHAGVELLAKTLQLLVHRSADYNFVETAGFLGTVSRTAEANPSGMCRLAEKLTNVEPEVRDRFSELSIQVGKKARERDAIQASAAAPAPPASEKRVGPRRR